MNKFITPLIMSLTLTAGVTAKAADDEVIIDKPQFVSTDGVFTIDALESLGSVTGPVVSPDGKKVLFGISYESVEHNRSNRDLYVMNVDGTGMTRLTRSARSENNAVWIDGGRRIAFVTSEGDAKPQIWVMDADGSNRRCVSNVEQGVDGFVFSPDGKKVVIIAQVKYARTAQDIYPDLPEATGRVVDDLMYKHWDEWVTTIPHPFIGDFDGENVTGVYDIMQDEPFEAPMKPFGGAESFAWTPDSKKLIYVSRKKTGVDYALSTNSNLYLYDIATRGTECLTTGMNGYDTMPVISPDGKYVAWLSMEHDGYESDKNRIMLMEFATGTRTDLTSDWDYTADNLCWNPDGKSIYFIAPKDGVTPVFSINIKTKAVTVVADGQYDYASLAPVDAKTLITMRHSMVHPNDIYSVTAGREPVQLTDINADVFAQVTMPTVEKRMVPTVDGKEMCTWMVYPPNFDKTKQYPAILYCQGGPQQAVSQFWSSRWNFAAMASQGYVIIAPNRRGLPGFGTEWNAQISKDYPGLNMKDYLAAVDDVKTEPYIDAKHIGAVGASYGGFSVYWLAGNHDNRFAAFIAHAGIFNMEAQYLETEEMWFANWDMGGAPWDRGNAIAKRTFELSPHKFVDRWNTPILVLHGEYDFRILASQGMMAFNAAKLRNVPAEMVIFPDENHWILKPQNAVMWYRVYFRWLDRWLKPQK